MLCATVCCMDIPGANMAWMRHHIINIILEMGDDNMHQPKGLYQGKYARGRLK